MTTSDAIDLALARDRLRRRQAHHAWAYDLLVHHFAPCLWPLPTVANDE